MLGNIFLILNILLRLKLRRIGQNTKKYFGRPMKKIAINKLQNEISRVIKEVETGETFEVMRYSEPVAYLISQKEYERLESGENCKKCVMELRQFIKLKNEKDKERKNSDMQK